MVRLSASKRQDAADWGFSNEAPTVRLVRNTAIGARLRALLTSLPAPQVPADAFGDLYHQRWRIKEAFKRLKTRLHLEAVSSLSQLALLADVAAQDDAQLPANRRCQRTHADAAVCAILPRVLLAVGDVLGFIDDTLDLMVRTVHRIKPGRSTPRKPVRAKRTSELGLPGGWGSSSVHWTAVASPADDQWEVCLEVPVLHG